MARRRYSWIASAVSAAAFGIVTLSAARHDPVGSFAGTSTTGAIAELGAGWSLVAAGALFSLRDRGNLFGFLLAAAGFAWFLPEWSNPGVGTAFGFTIGLIGFSLCVPLVGHAALAYPTGRLRSRVAVGALAISYAGAFLLLGLLPATVFDPKTSGCVECPTNLVLVRADPGLFETLNRYGLRIGIGWLAALGGLLLWRLLRSTRAAAVVVPVLAAGVTYVALVARDFQHSLGRGVLGNDSFDRALWRYDAAALAALAVAVCWGLLRERSARAAFAGLVLDFGRMARPGAVREALAEALGDPRLEIAYRRRESGRYVDASGRPVKLEPRPGLSVTPLLRGDTPVAALLHDVRLLDQPGLVHEVLAAARIAVVNEQLQAEVNAQLEELRASRARIVEAGDAERRRLERNLHDGAQQQLVGLSYDLRLARAAAEAEAVHAAGTLLAGAGGEAQAALAELRELAHGIYPAVLSEAGLGPALETLADEAPLPVELEEPPPERFSAPVETAAYVTVADAVNDAAARGATLVSAELRRQGDQLLVAVEDDGEARMSELVHLADRIGALGGSLELAPGRLRAEIPCA